MITTHSRTMRDYLDEAAITFARRGLYAENLLEGLPPAYMLCPGHGMQKILRLSAVPSIMRQFVKSCDWIVTMTFPYVMCM